MFLRAAWVSLTEDVTENNASDFTSNNTFVYVIEKIHQIKGSTKHSDNTSELM